MPLGYELVAEIDVTSSTTQVDFTGINFTNDDDLLLVCNFNNDTVSGSGDVYLLFNGDTALTNYYRQTAKASSTSVSADMANNSLVTVCGSMREAYTNINIMLSESGYVLYQAKTNRDIVPTFSDIKNIDVVGARTSTITSITQITIKHITANAISTGSNFKLYKLVARKLADITIESSTSSVDITGLSLDETNELLLVSEVFGNITTNEGIRLFVNSDVTESNYRYQNLKANSTSVTASRYDLNRLCNVENNKYTVVYSILKMTNSGHFSTQNHTIKNIGTSGILIENYHTHKQSTITSITSLHIASADTNGIDAGSRFKLYKLK